MLFILKMRANFSVDEFYSLPIKLRNWFVERLGKYCEEPTT